MHRRPEHRVIAPSSRTLAGLLALLSCCAVLLAAHGPGGGDEAGEERRAEALAGITEDEVTEHLAVLAAPELEGRDSPSRGLEAAARYLDERFEELGLEPAIGGTYRSSFSRRLQVPASSCAATVSVGGDAPESLVLGRDFVPLPRCVGEASGPAVFCGFGIHSKKKPRWNDFKDVDLDGAIAVLFEGEPRHRKLFDGPAISPAADVYAKVAALEERGAVGAVVVRRPPPDEEPDAGPPAPELGYRYTWASWLDGDDARRAQPSARIPVVEVSPAVASRWFGMDSEELAARGDGSGRPLRFDLPPMRVTLKSDFDVAETRVDNVVGILRGADPARAEEYVVVGAHYDHIGVDARGRIGCGADDNASGTAALLEVVEALAVARPARSVLVCAFAAEEDGLVGSRAIAQDPPVPAERMVAMLNLDMIGRGDDALVVVLGTRQNPALGEVLDRARRLGETGIRKLVTNKAAHLWERSDHHSFHQVGVPVLFFFEAEHESENPDYHTYRDTLELVSVPKVANTARLAFQTAWILATDEERPPAPRD